MTAGEEATTVKPGEEITPGPNAVDVSPQQDGGVLKEIIKEGEGDAMPASGCTVSVHYEGKLTNGTIFDSSKSREPFKFVLGKESVIKAWEIGVMTMKKGEVALLTCKPEYAYGNSEQPKIPAGSTLIFEITMIDWERADLTSKNDGGIMKTKTYVIGKGYRSPQDGAVVEVHLIGKCEGKVFEDRDVKFNLGEGSEFGVVYGVERALKKFKKGEKSVLEITSKYAFKEEGNPELGVPPNADVEYIVELKNFEQPPRLWEMTPEERFEQGKLLKEKATNYYKANKYSLAIKFYNQSTECITSDLDNAKEAEMNDEMKALQLATKLNLALAYLKLNSHYEAKKSCDEALEIDPDNVKGLFRRGQAYLGMGEPENAKLDFEAVVKLEPSNKLAANQIIVCQNITRQQREKEKKIYANMFEKFARKDKEKEELTVSQQPDTMKVLGEWGRDERDREPTEFEQENPDILMLNKNDEFKNM